MYKSFKICVKSSKRFVLKLATNGQSDKDFLLASTFSPKGLSAPALGLYTCIKALKYTPGPGVRRAFTGPLVLWFVRTSYFDSWNFAELFLTLASTKVFFIAVGQALWSLWQLIVSTDLRWEQWKLRFIAISLQIFWRKFHRNVCGVVHQAYHFNPNLSIWLVAMANERLNLWNNINKSTPQKLWGG